MFENGIASWRANLATLQREMPAILGPLPVLDHVRCAIPTWFIRGELSDRITERELPLIEQWFADFRIDTVAGGGHWPHAEAPAAFLTIFQHALSI